MEWVGHIEPGQGMPWSFLGTQPFEACPEMLWSFLSTRPTFCCPSESTLELPWCPRRDDNGWLMGWNHGLVVSGSLGLTGHF